MWVGLKVRSITITFALEYKKIVSQHRDVAKSEHPARYEIQSYLCCVMTMHGDKNKEFIFALQ